MEEKNTLTMAIKLDATQLKAELNEIEAQVDRILEKWERVNQLGRGE